MSIKGPWGALQLLVDLQNTLVHRFYYSTVQKLQESSILQMVKRINVSMCYVGAPFYAAQSALRFGADLCSGKWLNI